MQKKKAVKEKVTDDKQIKQLPTINRKAGNGLLQ